MTQDAHTFSPTEFLHRDGLRLALYRWPSPHSARAPVLLLHGFPDNAGVWQGVAQALSAEHRVAAYDVRGAGRSDRPAAVADYRMDALLDDLRAVIDHISPGRPVHLVGHDLGSVQGWAALADPQLASRIASFSSISGPGLDRAGAWLRKLRGGRRQDRATLRRQLLRSWYVGFFHLPVLPALLWRHFLGRLWPWYLRRVERIPRPPHNPTQGEDGACGTALYRANIRAALRQPAPLRSERPVQLIVPRHDLYLLPALWDEFPFWTSKGWRRDVAAGHWLPLSHPRELAGWVASFIAHLEGGALPEGLRPVQSVAADDASAG